MNKTCPSCGKPLPPDAPGGLCPQCLLAGGLKDSGKTSDYTPFEAPSVAEIAALFPQLEVLELLGAGGMGAVYKARQPGLDRFVALKVLPRRDDPAFAERFMREARALAKLSHPGIVTVHDFGQTGGLYYFVMEYVDGVNLRQAERGKLTPAEALAIVPQICTALQFAHDAGVVHRDIKPENILLDAKGRVKIADFGLAKLSGKDTPNPLTHTHQVMGTIHYMAPEQWEKPSTVDHRADIYSLGVVFYELLTGELPLGRFPLPSERVQVDVRLDDIVLRTLEKQPERRYQHASEVKTDVEKVATPAEPSASAQHMELLLDETDRVRRPLQHVGVLAGAFLFLVGIVLLNTELPKSLNWLGGASLVGATGLLWVAGRQKQHWESSYKTHRIMFRNSVFFGEELFIDGVSVARGGFGYREELQGTIPSGEGAGDRIIAWSEAGVRHFRLRLFAEPVTRTSTPPTLPVPSQTAASSSLRPPGFFRQVALPALGIAALFVAGYIVATTRSFHSDIRNAGEIVTTVVGFGGTLITLGLFIRWLWLTRNPKRPAGFWLGVVGLVVVLGLGAGAAAFLMFLPRHAVQPEGDADYRKLIIGTWTWTGGRVEFRADGTFEERFRETVPDVKVGEPIDPEKQKFVERDSTLVGQYNWATHDVLWVKSAGRAPRQVTVVVTETELTLKENDGGVRRMTKLSPAAANAESPTQQRLFGAWTSTVGDMRYQFLPNGTFNHMARVKADPQAPEVENQVTGRYRWQDDQTIEFRPADGHEGEILELHFAQENTTWSVKGQHPRIKLIPEHDGFVVLKEHGEVGARLKRAGSTNTTGRGNILGTWTSVGGKNQIEFRFNGRYMHWVWRTDDAHPKGVVRAHEGKYRRIDDQTIEFFPDGEGKVGLSFDSDKGFWSSSGTTLRLKFVKDAANDDGLVVMNEKDEVVARLERTTKSMTEHFSK